MRWLKALSFILLCEAVGLIGGLITGQSFTGWYEGLRKPALNPPGWVFAPVWTSLYFLMGISVSLVWQNRREPAAKTALALFFFQLFLNGVWTPVFFGLRSVGGGLIVISFLLVSVWAVIVRFWRISHTASLLLVPYLLWTVFAAYLNASLYLLNK